VPAEDITYVAVCPSPALSEDLVARAGQIISRDAQSTRHLLSASIPRLAAHFPIAQQAEEAAGALRALGLRSFACADAFLRKSSRPLSARQMAVEQAGAVFSAKNKESLTLRADQVFLILQGLRYLHSEEETTQTRTKLNIPATVLTGGIPFFKKVTVKGKRDTSSGEFFIRLYARDEPEPLVEIRQRDFDYSLLGPQIAPSSLVNLARTANEMRRLFPRAVFDDRLTRPLVAQTVSSLGWDVCEVNCRLVYLERSLGVTG
jgi:hypothetical protein